MATDPATLPANFVFRPTEEFTSHWGTYYPGNSYNCTPAQKHNALREKCALWLDEGKIEIKAVAGFTVTNVSGG